MLASASHAPTLVWGILLIAVGVVHLVFRRYFARRSAAVQRARRDTAPGPFKRLTPLTGEASNLALTTVVSGAMVVVGLVLLAVSLS